MALTKMGLLISPEVCIGCRGCQAACKAWNILPAVNTVNLGSYENPRDLIPYLYNKIHYIELPSDKDPVRWLFLSQRCMHCQGVRAGMPNSESSGTAISKCCR